jgi:Uma2 family endonuclease
MATMTKTRPRFGPADHGRRVTDRVATTAEYVEGFNYEVIDGRLHVSPRQEVAESVLENWLYAVLMKYADRWSKVIGYLTPKARVFVPDAARTMAPEPDLTAYTTFPDYDTITSWKQISPFLVVGILSENNVEKQLGRNPNLYLRVPSIQEYWVVNGAENPDEPSLIHYVRRGKRWAVTTHPFGATFTPKVLPGFSLVIDPRRR